MARRNKGLGTPFITLYTSVDNKLNTVVTQDKIITYRLHLIHKIHPNNQLQKVSLFPLMTSIKVYSIGCLQSLHGLG